MALIEFIKLTQQFERSFDFKDTLDNVYHDFFPYDRSKCLFRLSYLFNLLYASKFLDIGLANVAENT